MLSPVLKVRHAHKVAVSTGIRYSVVCNETIIGGGTKLVIIPSINLRPELSGLLGGRYLG